MSRDACQSSPAERVDQKRRGFNVLGQMEKGPHFDVCTQSQQVLKTAPYHGKPRARLRFQVRSSAQDRIGIACGHV